MSNSCSTSGQCGPAASSCQGPCCRPADQSCGCGSGSCNCGSSSCGSDACSGFIGLVKCAKESLLKEKVKAKLEAKMGKKLDRMAEMAVDMYIGKKEFWKQASAKKEEAERTMQQLMEE